MLCIGAQSIVQSFVMCYCDFHNNHAVVDTQQHDSEIVAEHENPASSTCDHCAMLLTLLTVARFN